MFALNQGEVCTCPSRALVQESIADQFLELAVERVKRIKTGHPLDTGNHDWCSSIFATTRENLTLY